MEDKLIVSIESHGFKHTTEASNQVDVYEFSEIVFNLMCLTGYHRDSIIKGLKEIIEQEEQ
jgi:hypothetical protein